MALTTVCLYSRPRDAHIASGFLAAHGIPAHINHAHHVWANWTMTAALGRVKLRVSPADYPEAVRLPHEAVQGETERELERRFPRTRQRCPACDHDNITSQPSRRDKALLLISFFLCGVIFPLRRNRHRCCLCPHRWRE